MTCRTECGEIMASKLNRRQFLRNSTLAAGAALAGPWVARGAEKKKLRIALIGIGGRGRNAIGFARGEQVAALCDVDTRRLDAGGGNSPAKLFSAAKKYQDYRELFEHPNDFDAVAVSTPDHQHYPAAIRAIRAGKAVFCEKPLTWSVWEAQQLAAEAEKHKIPTQMGNQGMSGHGWRLAHAYVQAGAIGQIKETHCWTGSHDAWFANGVGRPEGEDPVPAGLDWNLWIGPAPMRPYKNGHYHPRRWRGWVDFGGGGLGDWCCHILNAMYKIYQPGDPTSVECFKNTGFTGETYPKGKAVRWEVPAAGGRPAFDAYWYDGTTIPPRPAGLEAGRALGGSGCFLVGTKGTVWVTGGHNNSAMLIPESKRRAFGRPKIVAPASRGHNKEFVMAAKGLIPYNAPLSHFGYAGKLTAFALMANIAGRVPGKLLYDAKAQRFTNSDAANKLLTRKPREGWYL